MHKQAGERRDAVTFTLPPRRTHFPVNLDGHVARATLSRLSLDLSLFATMPFSFFRASQCPLFFTFILFFFLPCNHHLFSFHHLYPPTENTDSRDSGWTGPISWVLLTNGTHLITADTEKGSRPCQSFILDQHGPSQLLLSWGKVVCMRVCVCVWVCVGCVGGYLSYSIVSICTSVDNERLAFFVAVLPYVQNIS